MEVHDRIVLIEKHQNPKGRMLVQTGSILHVWSECCSVSINKKDIGIGYTDYCANCLGELGFNKRGWGSFVVNILPSTGPSIDERWAEWAVHWFGLEDFKMEVTL